ncbi:MAG: ZPR1 zinc finger domain-containing protein [Candidatus Lokiarchaeota archaeon]|nr:ZPR1 zinc finger domain-containing protein [Candidatus Lokiarchaeota archaeon]MBD3339132.1 ZPR1 zinc finger domain-containing protein [Candidatus Lokiarchaeota archaeon]
MAEEKKNHLNDLAFKCPSCKEGTIIISKTEYDLPDGDKMLIIKFECDSCLYHKNDVIPFTTRMEPGVMTLKIENEEDLKSKIYRSPAGKLEIPELDLVVEPGPQADFYYTNVEGILMRFENAISIYKNSIGKDDKEKEEIDELQKDIKKAILGKFPFTLKIIDTGGGSYIIAVDKSKYCYKPLNQSEEN